MALALRCRQGPTGTIAADCSRTRRARRTRSATASSSPVRRNCSPLLELHEADLAVGILLPHVPDVVDGRAVALLVVGNIADDGVEGYARVHDFRDLLRIEGVRLFRRLLEDLHGGVGIEGVALRVEPLRLEGVDRILRVRIVPGFGT